MKTKAELKALISKMCLIEKLKWINEQSDVNDIINRIVNQFTDEEIKEEIKKFSR